MLLFVNTRRHLYRRGGVNRMVNSVVAPIESMVKSMVHLSLCISIMSVCSVNASTFDLQAVGKIKGKLIQHSNTQQDMLVPAAPKKGVSYNKFGEFSVSKKPLVIFNGGGAKGAFNAQAPAKTIVIEATKMVLEQDIKIVGQPADILLLVKGAKQTITCTNCGFDNINRVTMAVATMGSKPEDMLKKGKVGQLSARAGGTIKVNKLSAPGILSLELLADNITTAGVLDLNLRADSHPQGGYIVHPKGNKIVGSGGINLYSGLLTINYDDLAIKAAKESASSHTVGGNLKAASIAIASPKKIVIAKNTKLNTASDILATSTHNGQFYAPNEGIYLQTIAASNTLTNKKGGELHQGVELRGQLISDNLLSIKSSKDIKFTTSAKVITHDAKFMAITDVRQQGFIQADNQVDIAAKRMINNAKITAGILNIETTYNIHNSFGGRLKATNMALKSNKGFVVNGSRSQREAYSDGSLKALPLTKDPTALKFGIFYDVNEKTGKVNKQVSAHILANKLAIQAKAIENINPYSLEQSNKKEWSAGIRVDNRQAQQVSIQVENQLDLKADIYVLNASAILGLNQAGRVTIDTAKFSNERYRLQAESYAFKQLLYDPANPKEENESEEGVVTKIIAYSPPARFYSFGDLHIGNKLKSIKGKGHFINEFSYFEVFQNSHFRKTQFNSFGLELSKVTDIVPLTGVRECLRYRNCEDEIVTTLAEAETLTAFHGNVYGVNKNSPSFADLEIGNINVLDAKKSRLVKDYLASLFVKKSEYDYTEVKSSQVDEHYIKGDLRKCKPKLNGNLFELLRGADIAFGKSCKVSQFSKSIDELVSEDLDNREWGSSGYTNKEIRLASEAYVKKLPLSLQPEFSIEAKKLWESYVARTKKKYHIKFDKFLPKKNKHIKTIGIENYKNVQVHFNQSANYFRIAPNNQGKVNQLLTASGFHTLTTKDLMKHLPK
ncbi:hypothetical protein [uncultured Shewanella sp.]|uniref:hypothetical protein n=1 Tax=uncultured Shewanella sp. TaxID=173975 RepID=UPI00261E17C0|nr:hypothetical protein [uncultured Shewanella sp.]